MRRGLLVASVILLGMALVMAGCSGGGSSKKPPPRLQSATFTDGAPTGTLGAGDEIVIVFSKDVTLAVPAPTAAAVFELLNGVTWGSSMTAPGATGREVIIQVANDADFRVNGTYPSDPLASGLRILGTQSDLTYGNGKPVRQLTGNAVDIDGTIVPPTPWNVVPTSMVAGRMGHSATLLPQGFVLIVGGMDDVASSVNVDYRRTLSSIEVFDPGAGTFTDAGDVLVHGRAYHKAVSLPGSDGNFGTNDDWIAIVGGWNSDRQDSEGGPRSESALEVIVPDWNGDGDIGDLVVNPTPGGAPSGVELDDYGTTTLGIGAGGANVTTGFGFQAFDAEWTDGTVFGGGPNDVIVPSGFVTLNNDNAGNVVTTPLWFTGNYVPPDCENRVPYFVINQNGDADFASDSFAGTLGLTGSPTAAPALTRWYYTSTRVAGPDNLLGTTDDVIATYGGLGLDTTVLCNGASASICVLGDLEFYTAAGAWNYTGVNDSYTTCGLACSAPGTGATDRLLHVAVATGNASQQVALLAGQSSVAPPPYCAQAVEILTPDVNNPGSSTLTYGGNDSEPNRAMTHGGGLLATTGNVLFAGGLDDDAAVTLDAAELVTPSTGLVTSVGPMNERRGLHAAVGVPAGTRGTTEDRVYLFGGHDRTGATWFYVLYNATFEPGTTSSTAEYYRE